MLGWEKVIFCDDHMLCTLQAWLYCRWPQSCTCSAWLLEVACLLPASGAAWHPAPAPWSPQVVRRTSLPRSLPRTLTLCLSLFCNTWCESRNYLQSDSFLQLGRGSQIRQFRPAFLLSCVPPAQLSSLWCSRIPTGLSRVFPRTEGNGFREQEADRWREAMTNYSALADRRENISCPCPG